MSGEVLDVRLGCMKLHVLAQCCLKLHSFELSGRAGVTKAVPGEGPGSLQLMGLARIAAMRVVPGGSLPHLQLAKLRAGLPGCSHRLTPT